ncbi:MAG TPA: nucleotidyltransferase family protein [Gemmatimonadales bacterium]|nr:nucleotidyltransferase family protein [Gemmatimonadales bacterium]
MYALLLAAGESHRFGENKLLAPLHGRPLIAHTAAAVAEAITGGILAGGVAVVPSGATELAWPLDTAGLTLVENPDPAAGLARSLRLGLAAVEAACPTAGAALVLLADQPGVRIDVIARLVAAWRAEGRSVRPRYLETPDQPGHPVLVDRSLWPLVRELEGDTGLGPALAARPDAVTVVEVGGRNPDVDTPEDLRQLEESG